MLPGMVTPYYEDGEWKKEKVGLLAVECNQGEVLLCPDAEVGYSLSPYQIWEWGYQDGYGIEEKEGMLCFYIPPTRATMQQRVGVVREGTPRMVVGTVVKGNSRTAQVSFAWEAERAVLEKKREGMRGKIQGLVGRYWAPIAGNRRWERELFGWGGRGVQG